MAPIFAKDTQVSVSRSQFDVHALLTKYGASNVGIGFNEIDGVAVVVFRFGDQGFRLELPMPTLMNPGYVPDHWDLLSDANKRTYLTQGTKARWRSLVLLVKAKLEAIRIGLTTARAEFPALNAGPSTGLARTG